MKKISPQQIQAIIDELFKLNIPVQLFSSIQKLFQGLEDIPEEDTKK